MMKQATVFTFVLLGLFSLNSCTFLQSANFSQKFATNTPIPTAPTAVYCNTICRVSLDSNGVEGNGYSMYPMVTADGRYVILNSGASNLVSGDTNGVFDVFKKDMLTGVMTLVSSDSLGVLGNADSIFGGISADGRYVVFDSQASNLVSGDTNGGWDVFMKDTQTGITTLISTDSSGVQGSGLSEYSSISSDGRYVVFGSLATNLVSGDINGNWDIFMKDTQTGVTTLISTDSAGVQHNGTLAMGTMVTTGGHYVVFGSNATNLVSGDTNGKGDIFMKNTQTGVTTLISSDSLGVQGNDDSYMLWLTPNYGNASSDGRYVVFESLATNLVSGDTNGSWDIFMKDTVTGITTLVSSDSLGVQGNGASYDQMISADGRYVVFSSDATNFATGDTNGGSDVFVKNLATGELKLVSVNDSGVIANSSYQAEARISADGSYVVFTADADNLVTGDTAGQEDVFIKRIVW